MSGRGEEALRELIAERVAAVTSGRIEPLVARLDADVVTFDVLPPLMSRGRSSVTDKAHRWFDGYQGGIGYEVRELDVHADERLGWCSFAYHVSGTLTSGELVDMWVRATLCCELRDGAWVIAHDHESVPFDPATGRAKIDLRP